MASFFGPSARPAGTAFSWSTYNQSPSSTPSTPAQQQAASQPASTPQQSSSQPASSSPNALQSAITPYQQFSVGGVNVNTANIGTSSPVSIPNQSRISAGGTLGHTGEAATGAAIMSTPAPIMSTPGALYSSSTGLITSAPSTPSERLNALQSFESGYAQARASANGGVDILNVSPQEVSSMSGNAGSGQFNFLAGGVGLLMPATQNNILSNVLGNTEARQTLLFGTTTKREDFNMAASPQTSALSTSTSIQPFQPFSSEFGQPGIFNPIGLKQGWKDIQTAFTSGGITGVLALPAERAFIEPAGKVGESIAQFFNIEKSIGKTVGEQGSFFVPGVGQAAYISITPKQFSPSIIEPSKQYFSSQGLPSGLAYVQPTVGLVLAGATVAGLGYGAIEYGTGKYALSTARNLDLVTTSRILRVEPTAESNNIGFDIFNKIAQKGNINFQQTGEVPFKLIGETGIQFGKGKVITEIGYENPLTGAPRKLLQVNDILKGKGGITENVIQESSKNAFYNVKGLDVFNQEKSLTGVTGFKGDIYTRPAQTTFMEKTIFGKNKVETTVFDYGKLAKEGTPFANIERNSIAGGSVRMNEQGDILSISGKITGRKYKATGEFVDLGYKPISSTPENSFFQRNIKKVYFQDISFTPERTAIIKIIKPNERIDLGVLGRGRGGSSTFKDLYGQDQITQQVSKQLNFPSALPKAGGKAITSMKAPSVNILGKGIPSYVGGAGRVISSPPTGTQLNLPGFKYNVGGNIYKVSYPEGNEFMINVQRGGQKGLINGANIDITKLSGNINLLDNLNKNKNKGNLLTGTSFGNVDISGYGVGYKVDTGFGYGQPQAITQIQPQPLKQIEKMGQPTPFAQPPISTNFDFGIPKIPFGFLPEGLGQQPISKPYKTKGRKYKRSPSFAALQLGYTSTEKAIGEFTGLAERPILTRKRRKK